MYKIVYLHSIYWHILIKTNIHNFCIERDACTLPAVTGECDKYIAKWYYDTSIKGCRQFYYGGCGGNDNNFNTEELCLDRCEKRVKEPEPQPEETPFRTGRFILKIPLHLFSCFDVKNTKLWSVYNYWSLLNIIFILNAAYEINM